MEILMVKKRYTFYYIEFILGHYTSIDDPKLIYLFNRMSNEEKLDIESGNFDQMWIRAWREIPHRSDYEMFMKYHKCKKKFDNCFKDSMKGLRDLLGASTSQDTMWEIPKGRKNNGSVFESELSCAIREFVEETGLPSSQFYIVPNKTFDMNFSNKKAQYISKFYIAVASSSTLVNRKFKRRNPKVVTESEITATNSKSMVDARFPSDPRLNFANHHQLLEVIDVQWINLEELKFLDQSKRFYTTVNNIFKMLRSQYNIPKLTELNMLNNMCN
jgi:8-oxo-dGTP pyrophosphatase MutT (NUDIX family)